MTREPSAPTDAAIDRDDVTETPLDALRAQAAADPALPPFVRKLLAEGAPLEAIRLDGYGRWWHEGHPIDHPRVRALFHRSLARTEAGTWVLRVPPYTYPVLVDDVGHFVVRLIRDADGWSTLSSTGQREPLDPTTWMTDGDAWLGVRIHGGRDPARLVGAAHQTALDAIDADEDGWFVALDGDDGDVARIGPRTPDREGRES